MLPMPAASGRQAAAAAAVVADLGSGDEWRAAASTVVDSARHGPGVRTLVGLAATLASPSNPAAGAQPDMRRRQRLDHLAGLLLDLPGTERRRMQEAINGVAAALGADRSLLDLQQRLRMATVDWRSPSEVRQVLLLAVGQCATRPMHVEGLAGRVQEALDADADAWEPEQLLRMAGELATRAGLAAPRAAVAMAAVAGPRRCWSQPWRDLVLSLRDHPEPEVASAARSLDGVDR